ncbi:FtsQ-type POTRA domain-containing protein [Aliigemmobacter aestuarii]|uniref:Cell division protein FtsQ n=1 Tax=Aliigemmobacter aestuarii TaxID=1445661 RepID=A0A4S3MJD3_9RHOB|nr:cell division protein FtsQ/DivIB [Gemmobacter aestuarii]THD81199.1 FtsQ-type POTRA domain-containing protein [Gemmobacter aestuarii]
MRPLGAAPRRLAPPHAGADARPATAARRDPAPSRVAYRLHRLWLTPVFRVAMRVGMPAFVLALASGVFLSDDARREAVVAKWTEMREAFEQRPEFMVSMIAVDGASNDLADAVRKAAALSLPRSSFDLDLDAARMRIEALDAVRSAELRVKSGGVVQIDITERLPAVVLRRETALELLDAEGHRVAMLLARGDRPDLPLLAGTGAEDAVPEALALVAAAEPILPRLRGLVRISERRWDLLLDRDQRILLPADQPVRALERLLALDKAEDLLARDIAAVDLRLKARPVLRLAPYALSQLRGIDETETVGDDL